MCDMSTGGIRGKAEKGAH